MKLFKVPCSWTMYGCFETEAENLEQAIQKAKQENTSLPEGSFVDASFRIERKIAKEININGVIK